MNVWEPFTYGVWRFLNHCIGQSDHWTEYESIFYHIAFLFGLTVHEHLRVKQHKSIINHTAFHFTRVYSTPHWAIHTGSIHTAENEYSVPYSRIQSTSFYVVLVCCVGIPHPHFVRLVSSDHSLPILYIFLYILLCTSPKITFISRKFLL